MLSHQWQNTLPSCFVVCMRRLTVRTPDFKWRGWSSGGKNQNPQKSLGLPTKPKKKCLGWKLTPKKSHVEFPSLTNFQMHYNALNIETAAQQVWLYFICRTTRSWHYLWINAPLTRFIVLSSNLIKGKECKCDFTKLYQTWAMRSMRCLSEK